MSEKFLHKPAGEDRAREMTLEEIQKDRARVGSNLIESDQPSDEVLLLKDQEFGYGGNWPSALIVRAGTIVDVSPESAAMLISEGIARRPDDDV